MNEDQLKAILARNPQLTVSDQMSIVAANPWITNTDEVEYVGMYDALEANRKLSAKKPKRRKKDALDEVVQGEAPRQVRPRVRFTFYRVRLQDADARAHGCKDMLDGLVEAGLIPGDREDQIDFDARQEKVHYKKDERTEIEITLP